MGAATASRQRTHARRSAPRFGHGGPEAGQIDRWEAAERMWARTCADKCVTLLCPILAWKESIRRANIANRGSHGNGIDRWRATAFTARMAASLPCPKTVIGSAVPTASENTRGARRGRPDAFSTCCHESGQEIVMGAPETMPRTGAGLGSGGKGLAHGSGRSRSQMKCRSGPAQRVRSSALCGYRLSAARTRRHVGRHDSSTTTGGAAM